MTIINTFSNRQRLTTICQSDLFIWILSCIQYKKLGYTLKLYCTEHDIQYLKDHFLYNFYDEIDTQTFDNTDFLQQVDGKEFWFIRKLAAIQHEFDIGNTDFIYSDTDIVLFERPIITDCDIYTWCLEQPDSQAQENIYCDWQYLSLPEGYTMPDFIKNTTQANYNTGLLYIKDRKVFDFYKQQVLNFCIGNPCICTYPVIRARYSTNLWACNAEQRILTGVCNHFNLSVKVFDKHSIESAGLSPAGCHYFIIRYILRMAAQANTADLSNDIVEGRLWAIQRLLDAVLFGLQLLYTEYPDIFNYFYNQEFFKQLLSFGDTVQYLSQNYNS